MFDWAENEIKCRQAIDEIRAEKGTVVEADVLARYIRKGGVVVPVEQVVVKSAPVKKVVVVGKKKSKK